MICSKKERPYLNISPSWCTLIKKDGESNARILLLCNFAYYIWVNVKREFEVVGAFPKLWRDFLCIDWGLRGRKKKAKLLWMWCCMAAAWNIWLEHNTRIFKDRTSDASEIWSKIKFTPSIWAFSS